MIQIHTVDGIEAAIQLDALIPKDSKPKSRHRFWIGRYRVDAYLNREGTLFIHWLNRDTKQHAHPRVGGMTRCRQYSNGQQIYLYQDDGRWTHEFKASAGMPDRQG